MADPLFDMRKNEQGEDERIDVDGVLRRLIDNMPRVGSVDAQLLLRDSYETTYGIYDHNQPAAAHPFALILQHWNENTVTLGPMHERMRQYIDGQILKYFGLPFDQFMELPTYVIEMMLTETMARVKKEQPFVDAAEALFKQGDVKSNRG